jgi:hypothetical protein
VLFAWVLLLAPLVSGHDPKDLPPKVTNLVASLRLVAVEITKDRYLLLLENTSDQPLRRLEWRMTHEEEELGGAFTAAASGLIAPGSLVDVPIPTPAATDEEHGDDHLSEEEAEAHRPKIVLEVGLFAGGVAQGDPKRLRLAAAHDEGARLALGPVLQSLKQLQERGGGRPALQETVERLRALQVPVADASRMSGADPRAAAEGFRAEVDAFAASLDLLAQATDDTRADALRQIVSNAERAQSGGRQSPEGHERER